MQRTSQGLCGGLMGFGLPTRPGKLKRHPGMSSFRSHILTKSHLFFWWLNRFSPENKINYKKNEVNTYELDHQTSVCPVGKHTHLIRCFGANESTPRHTKEQISVLLWAHDARVCLLVSPPHA